MFLQPTLGEIDQTEVLYRSFLCFFFVFFFVVSVFPLLYNGKSVQVLFSKARITSDHQMIWFDMKVVLSYAKETHPAVIRREGAPKYAITRSRDDHTCDNVAYYWKDETFRRKKHWPICFDNQCVFPRSVLRLLGLYTSAKFANLAFTENNSRQRGKPVIRFQITYLLV